MQQYLKWIVSLALSLPTIVVAQDGASSAAAFPKGTYTITATTGYAAGCGEGDEDIPWLAGGVNYYVIDNLSLGLELGGYYFSQPGDDALATTLSAVLRHHLIDRGPTTVFFDVVFGPSYSTEEVPVGGTHFNFMTRTGIGMTHELEENTHLLLGARYYHLSNGGIDGQDENPSINGVEFYVGVMWRW